MYPDLAPDSPPDRLLPFDTRVTVHREHRSFARVLTEDGHEGWVDRSQLLDSATRARLSGLERQFEAMPSQGKGRAWDTLNVHSEPYRWAPTFYQLAKDGPFEIVDRALVDRLPAAAARAGYVPQATEVDYWYLVRLGDIGQTGWLLENMAYADVPLEVGMLGAGQAIVASFALGNELPANSAKAAWLLAQSSIPRQEHDFDVLRVLRRHPSRNRYVIARLESGLKGYLPIEFIDRVESRGRTGMGYRVLVERSGELRERTYMLADGRVRFLGEAPSERAVHGGLGKRYEFQPATSR